MDLATGFLQQYYPAAQRVASATGVPAALILSRWAGETGWGKRILPGTNNLGNVIETRQGVDSVVANDNGNVRHFRKFGSVDDYADYEIGLLKRRYANALNTSDPVKHFTALRQAGYAEAPFASYVKNFGTDIYNSVVKRLPNVDTSAVSTPVSPSAISAIPANINIQQQTAPSVTATQFAPVIGLGEQAAYEPLDKSILSAIMPITKLPSIPVSDGYTPLIRQRR